MCIDMILTLKVGDKYSCERETNECKTCFYYLYEKQQRQSDNSVCKVALHNCVGGCFYPLVHTNFSQKHIRNIKMGKFFRTQS